VPSDASTLARALDLARRWWMIVAILIAGIGAYTASAMALGSHTDRIETIEKRLGQLESVDRRLERIEGRLDVLLWRSGGVTLPEDLPYE
jgi:hypothetical protein